MGIQDTDIGTQDMWRLLRSCVCQHTQEQKQLEEKDEGLRSHGEQEVAGRAMDTGVEAAARP